MYTAQKIGYNRYEVTLPSGEKAVLRKITVESLVIGSGGAQLPNPIKQKVAEGLVRGEATAFGDAPKVETSLSLDELSEYGALLELVARKSFITPRIVDDPTGDDEIHIDDVAFQDRLFCMQWSPPPQRVVDEVVDFRGIDGEQASAAGAAQDGGDVSSAPISGSGDTE